VKSASAALSASKARKIAEAKNARDGITDKVYEVKNLVGATVWVAVTNARGDRGAPAVRAERRSSVPHGSPDS
jgi:hypothetical protein